jgi:pyruvate,orthophosphate dikinase
MRQRDAETEPRFVYDFDEPTTGGRELLGGKGIGLAEMTKMGVPVPAGFTITTDACRAYMVARDLPAGLEDEVDEHVRRLEERAGKRFGSSDDPLLVSVRSGEAVSMPGMMDTILNLGLNDEAAAGLAARTDNARFAYDSYRRRIQMNAQGEDVVAGIRTPQPLETMRETLPKAFDQFVETMRRLEEHYRLSQAAGSTTGMSLPVDGGMQELRLRARD